MMIYGIIEANPPKIASGRRPTKSMIKKHTLMAISCQIFKAPDTIRDISFERPKDANKIGA